MTMRGQIGLCTTNGLIGRLIRAVTRSSVNHCVISLGNGLDISAEPGGVRIRPDTDWPPLEWSRFQLTPSQADAIEAFALDQEGKPYAWWDDILIGVSLVLGRRTPAWLTARLKRTDRWQCAELAQAALLEAGINLFPTTPEAAVYPGMFARVWKRHHWR